MLTTVTRSRQGAPPQNVAALTPVSSSVPIPFVPAANCWIAISWSVEDAVSPVPVCWRSRAPMILADLSALMAMVADVPGSEKPTAFCASTVNR